MNELSLFNSLFNGSDCFGLNFPEYRKVSLGVPKVDVKENEDSYVLDMDLPGRSENDVELNLKDNVLTISSVKEEKSEKKENKAGGSWLIKERTSSSFSRSFTLPEDVDGSAISASFKNGVLTVNMPRNKALSENKKIAITAA